MPNPSTREFPEGTVTVRLHRRKPHHILMDRRDVDVILAEEMEMQRTENKHLKKRLGEVQRAYQDLVHATRNADLYLDSALQDLSWEGEVPLAIVKIRNARGALKPVDTVSNKSVSTDPAMTQFPDGRKAP